MGEKVVVVVTLAVVMEGYEPLGTRVLVEDENHCGRGRLESL